VGVKKADRAAHQLIAGLDGRLAEQSEALDVVLVALGGVGALVGAIEGGPVEDAAQLEEEDRRAGPAHRPDLGPAPVSQPRAGAGVDEAQAQGARGGPHLGVEREQRGDLHGPGARRLERGGQRADHIGEAPGLAPGQGLGADVQHAQGAAPRRAHCWGAR
jgi:hypothetical protein